LVWSAIMRWVLELLGKENYQETREVEFDGHDR